MAKLISKHFGIITSIQPTEWARNMEEWAWRKKYENFLGIIHVYQSRHKNPDKHFIAIYDVDQDGLTTGVGELTYEGETITLITKNSKYTFRLLDINGKDG